MAAINCEQQEFALHSINDEYKNKTFVFVKLTDSALKSIQDYMSLNANVRQNIAKPTIQFNSNSNQGAITLPVNNSTNSNLLNENSSNNNKNEIRYSFNLSNVDADGPQGSFEFLRQRKTNKYEENIESLGSMFIKMQIHASEDIYQKTKVKMANAELDAKKHSTKVIKETGPNVGRKIKKTIINSSNSLGNTSNSNNNANSSTNSNSNEHSSYSSYKDLLLNNLSNNVNSSNSTLMNGSQENNDLSPKSSANLHLQHTSTNNSSTKYNKSLTTTAGGHLNGYNKDETSSTSLNSINHMTSIKDNLTINNSNINGVNCNNSNHNLNNTSERNSNNLNFTQSTNQIKSSTNPELLRKPVRDRVIHLLALRPYKKPEILAKLIRDGIRDREKKGLGVLLSQIASLKDNAYHLNRGAWHEVQVDDWSFYTNEERELVRKRNPLLNNNINNNNSNANNISNNTITNNLSSSAMNKDNTMSPLANFESNHLSNNLPFNLPQSPMHSPSSSKRTIDLQTTNSNVLEYEYTKTSKKQRISHHKANNDAIKKKSPPLCPATSSTISNSNVPSNSSSINNNLSSTNNYNNATNSSKKHPNTNTVLQTNKYHDVLNGWANKPKTPDEFSNSNTGHSNSNNSHSSPETNNSVNNFPSSSINGNKNSAKSGLNNYCRNNINNGSANNTNERYQLNSNTNLNISYLHNNKDNNSHTSNSHYHINNHHNHQYHHSNNGNNNSSHHHSNHNNHHYGNHFNNSNQQQHSSSLCSTPNSSPDSGTGSNDGSLSTVSSRCSNSGNDQPDYLSKYTEITSLEQRRRYESDFNCEYEEYKKLHNFLDRNAYKFAQLEQELRQAQEGTDNWNRIMERIVREYEEIKRDSSYLNAKNRMQYLHIKLSHIKNLVLNYDNAQYRKQINNDSTSNLSSPNPNNNTNVKLNSSNNSTSSSRIRSKHHHSSVQQQSNRSKMMITTS